MSKKIELNIKTENGYEVLYPKTDSSNNIVNTEILNKFGLNEGSNVGDVLNELGKYNEYWWRRRIPSTYTYIEKRTNIDSNKDIVSRKSGSTAILGNGFFEFSKQININLIDGTFSLSNPTKVYAWDADSVGDLPTVLDNLRANVPCYIKTFGDEYTNIFYLPENSTFNLYADKGFTVYSYVSGNYGIHLLVKSDSYSNNFVMAQKVATVKQVVPVSDWEYVLSSNRNAYPDNGTQDEYEYDYLGQPYENLKRGAQGELIKTLEIRPTTYIATEILSGLELDTGSNYFFIVDYEINGKRTATAKYYTNIVLKVKRTTLLENYNGGTITSFTFQNSDLTGSESGRSYFSINYFPSSNFKDISFLSDTGTSLHEIREFQGVKWDSTTPVYITLAWDNSGNSSYGGGWNFEGSKISVKIYKTTAF